MDVKGTWKMFCILVIFLAVTCQDVTSQTGHLPAVWQKANTSPVCFKAKGNQPGVFYAPAGGKLAAVSLVHLYGYVTCLKDVSASYWSFWGCGSEITTKNYVDAVITTSEDTVLLPPGQFNTYGNGKWAEIPGYNSNSPSLVMSAFSPPTGDVRAGDELRVWYGEDLVNWAEDDNDGEVCCDVYTLII